MKKRIGSYVFGILFLLAVFFLGYFFGSSQPSQTATMVILNTTDSETVADKNQWLPSRYGPAYRLNLNTATAEELQRLPGIGESLAERIIEYRTNNGAFKQTDELLNIEGIELPIFEEIRHMVEAGGQT